MSSSYSNANNHGQVRHLTFLCFSRVHTLLFFKGTTTPLIIHLFVSEIWYNGDLVSYYLPRFLVLQIFQHYILPSFLEEMDYMLPISVLVALKVVLFFP